MRLNINNDNILYNDWENIQFKKWNLAAPGEWEDLYESDSIDAILAENIWEYMSCEEGLEAVKNCYKFLKPGVYIICSVPDKNFKNEWYQNIMKFGGLDHSEHKANYDYKTFKDLFEQSGFTVKLLEYCDEDGDFHYVEWDKADGMISRSYRFHKTNNMDSLKAVSIIIDAKKEM